MKTTLLAVAAAFALTSLSVVAAPQDSKTESVQIKAADAFKIKAQDFQDYAYTYHLSNDDDIHFSQRVTHYYAEIRGEKKTEMFAVAPGVFVTAAGTRVEFQDDGYAVTISNYERLPMAQALPANTTMVAGR
jgi:hypothetical protein